MWNRRYWIIATLCAVLALGCGKQRIQTQVVVIGAGISGVAAAEHLKSRGVDVLVLEARDRIGGRIHSLQSEAGHIFEIGAGWIEGTEGNPLVALAEKLNLPAQSDDSEEVMWLDDAGKNITSRAGKTIGREFGAFVDHVEALRSTAGKDVPLATALSSYTSPSADRTGMAAIDFAIATEIEADYAGDRSELSLQHFDSDRGHGEESLIVRGGYDQIVKHLASKLEIRLGERVSSLDSHGDGVSVETANLRVEARHAIITVPSVCCRPAQFAFAPSYPNASGVRCRRSEWAHYIARTLSLRKHSGQGMCILSFTSQSAEVPGLLLSICSSIMASLRCWPSTAAMPGAGSTQ